MKKRKFPNDVARFFNPQKSGTNAEYKNKVIDEQLDAIRQIAPDIVIIEV